MKNPFMGYAMYGLSFSLLVIAFLIAIALYQTVKNPKV